MKLVGLLALSAALLTACQASTPPQVVDQIPGPDGHWDFATFDAANGRVLVSRSYGLLALDVAGRKISQAAPGDDVSGHLVLPDGRLLITNGGPNTVTLADGRTGAIVATIPAGRDPDAVVFDPATDKAFVMNKSGGDISVIDPKSATQVQRIAIGGTLESAAVDGIGRLFVNIEDRTEIAVIDTKTLQVKTHFKLAGCEAPTGLAYISAGRELISSCGNGHAKVISVQDGHEIADIKIGPHPDAVLYDPARAVAYIPSAGSVMNNGEITVLRIGAQGEVIAAKPIETQRGARTIAEDPRTGRLYLPTATYRLGAGGKPEPTPGTFKILVVAP